MNKRYIILLFVFSIILLSACSRILSDNSASNKNSEQIVKLVDASADVQSLYSARCLNCHAIDLSGVMGEPTNLQRVHERLSYDEIADVITNGRDIMPSFKERLSEDEIMAIAGWLSKQ